MNATLQTASVSLPSPAAVSASWIHEACRRTSQALGWNLEFVPPAESEAPAEPGIWQSEVYDGVEVLGRLQLRSSFGGDDGTDLPTAIAAVDVIADLVNGLACAQRRLESRSRDVQTLMELGRLLPYDGSLSGSLNRLLKAAVQLTGYWTSAFFLMDPHLAQLRLRATHNIDRSAVPRSERPLDLKSPDRSALLNASAIVETGNPAAPYWLPEGFAVGLCVPVSTAEGPLGSLWCYDRRHRRVTDRDVHVLQSVAAQITTVLERTVLLRESAARQRLRSELQAASVRHTGSAVGALPVDSGLDVAFRSVNAAELGGDLCEVWPIGPHQTLIAVGDAVGHSVPAALIMAVARGALRTLLQDGPAQLLQTDALMLRLNRALCTVTGTEQFMTMVCAVIDRQSMTMTYTNAGHPPPWLSRDGRRTPLQSHGLLLGVMPDAAYQHTVLPVRRGDLLVFFTDGVSEALSRDRNAFRTEGVLNALGDDPHQSASAAAEAIWRRLRGHLAEQNPADDQTLLVVKVQP